MSTGTVTLAALLAFLPVGVTASPADSVVVDFTMAERAVEWLQEVEAGAGVDELRASFREKVAPTAGTEAIVAHWARFREWDAEIFMEFVLAALGRAEPPAGFEGFTDEDGEPTALGLARRHWRDALGDLARLEADLEALRRADLGDEAVRVARAALPSEAEITARFYVVLFGVSPAFAVEDMNGYDLLQLPRTDEGDLGVADITRTFAHELHHSGFQAYIRERMGPAADDPNLALLGAATAEGLATCLVNRPHRESERWARALAGADPLMEVFEADLRRNLSGDLPREELIDRWFRGTPGPVYVVGVHMCETIRAAMGRGPLIDVQADFREYPALYNRAVPDDGSRFRFDTSLVESVLRYGT